MKDLSFWLMLKTFIITSTMTLFSTQAYASMFVGQAMSIPSECSISSNDLKAVPGLAGGLICWNGQTSALIFISGTEVGGQIPRKAPRYTYAAVPSTSANCLIEFKNSPTSAAAGCNGPIHYPIEVQQYTQNHGAIYPNPRTGNGGVYLLFAY